jgi:hypothetical protein
MNRRSALSLLHGSRATALLLALALLSSGCGYALAGRGSFLPEYIRVVGIPPIENRTTFFRVEQVLTEDVRSEFIGRSKYTVVSSAEGAHAVLSGAITSITLQPVGFTDQDLGNRYLFILTMRVQFTDATTSEVLWSNESLTFREEYDLSTRDGNFEGATFLEQEGAAVQRISSDVARTVVSAILEAF